MKTKIKKLLLVVCMVVCVLSLSACKNQNDSSNESSLSLREEFDYKQTSFSILYYTQVASSEELYSMFHNGTYSLITEEEINDMYDSFKDACDKSGDLPDVQTAYMNVSSIITSVNNGEMSVSDANESIDASLKSIGIKFGDITTSDEGTSVVITLECGDRDMDVSMKYDSEGNFESMSFTPEYSTGETIQKALLNTVMCMAIVFIVLIVIAFIISLFKYINKFEQSLKNNNANANSKKVEATVKKVETENEELVNDEELVAVITAAICASTNASSADGLVVRSIRKARRR